ncbi:bifunctional 5,10-methylenetetrahydrofolate dehydrogenase/5,10-methenyltetrahydrofolate cyclohydrolase [Lawsonibacter sp. LCP25S3_G6]|uniref:bifunctional 5,10-methylenetetrahydrofolate dehydrogenase/5,10-methenyltetrahydrofolate cyclohydrolase n=1 Tax=unclassified Lawsonibacter TaxID=2617946 RepID=UPI003F99D857
MSAVLMDGKGLSARIKEQVRAQVEKMSRRPGLAMVLVGEDPAAQVYEAGKRKDCKQCGIYYETYRLPGDVNQEELVEVVQLLNQREDIDGILIQFPLPEHLDDRAVQLAIRPDKDVDCVNPSNVGDLILGVDSFRPCTPAGVMRLLKEYDIDPTGKRCTVVGRSNIVGKPQAMLMLLSDATVTVCHTKTANLKEECLRADILITAAGKTGLITGDMVKEGAVVVDIAINRDDQGKLCGDAVFDQVAPKASYLTPVPGGVGPVTRAILMENTLCAARRHGKG